MKNKLLKIGLIAILSAGMVAPAAVLAQSKILQQFQSAASGARFSIAQDPKLAMIAWLQVGYGFIGVVLVSIIIYAGFLRFTAGGNDEAVGKSNKYFFNATLGLIIILSAYIITIYAYRLATANTKYACSSSSQCAKYEKCNLYGQCVDIHWCETSSDCGTGEKCTEGNCESANHNPWYDNSK